MMFLLGDWNRPISMTYFSFWLGILGGYGFDMLAFITRKN